MNMGVHLLDKILWNRISPIIENANIPTFKNNLAYKKKKSPQDILSLILDTLDIIKKHKINNAIVMSIDFSKAFDSLDHEYIIEFLSYVGFPDRFTGFLKTRFQCTEGILKDYQTNKPPFKITRGIPQGSALSGFLFTLCISTLLHQIEQNKLIQGIQVDLRKIKPDLTLRLPKLGAFADDLNIIMTVTKKN